jgi:AP2-associated kinase
MQSAYRSPYPAPEAYRPGPSISSNPQRYATISPPQAGPSYAPINGYVSSPIPPPNTYPSPVPQPPQQKHKGTLSPGQIIQVGDHSVKIERYLSEGGYAHVYLSSSDRPIYPPIKGDKKGRWGERGYSEHVLKRIAFEDEKVWTDVKKEIEVMVS